MSFALRRWLAEHRREITGACWNCGAEQVRDGWPGFGVSFFCVACQVGWSVQVKP